MTAVCTIVTWEYVQVLWDRNTAHQNFLPQSDYDQVSNHSID